MISNHSGKKIMEKLYEDNEEYTVFSSHKSQEMSSEDQNAAAYWPSKPHKATQARMRNHEHDE